MKDRDASLSYLEHPYWYKQYKPILTDINQYSLYFKYANIG